MEACGLTERKLLNEKRNNSVETEKKENKIMESNNQGSTKQPKKENENQQKQKKNENSKKNENEKKHEKKNINFKNLNQSELSEYKKESDLKFESLIQKRVQLALQMKQLEEEITQVVNDRNEMLNYLLNNK